MKREQYIGPWLPEPLAGVTPDVAETVADFDPLSLAFLVLLESLSPKERADEGIRSIYVVLNPDKLRGFAEAMTGAPPAAVAR